MTTRVTRNSARAALIDNVQGFSARRAQAVPPQTPSNNPEPDPNPDDDPDDNDDDPDDNDDGPPDPENPFHTPDPAPNLAEAITMLANNLRAPKASAPRAKLRDPDTFDGSDARKLQPFLVQCALNFRDRPDAFSSDDAKVTFALSYLKGTALDWFEPALMDPDEEPSWLSDYKEFVSELRTNFGPHDPEGEAEADLENLRMRENQRITKYAVEFNRLASRVSWGDSALRRRFYQGLPSRIKDEISRVGKPGTLPGLRTLAHNIDARYWERRSEVAHENTNSGKQSDRAPDKGKSTPATSDKKAPSASTSNPKPASTSGTSGSSSKKGPDLSDKLGKDGKLTVEERKRRFEQNLCLFCGRTGHVAKECPKSSSSASKACSAKITEVKSEPATATDSKK